MGYTSGVAPEVKSVTIAGMTPAEKTAAGIGTQYEIPKTGTTLVAVQPKTTVSSPVIQSAPVVAPVVPLPAPVVAPAIKVTSSPTTALTAVDSCNGSCRAGPTATRCGCRSTTTIWGSLVPTIYWWQQVPTSDDRMPTFLRSSSDARCWAEKRRSPSAARS